MKSYDVSVDITMSKSFSVEANSEEEAMAKVEKMINDNPYDYAHNFSHYVGCVAVSADDGE